MNTSTSIETSALKGVNNSRQPSGKDGIRQAAAIIVAALAACPTLVLGLILPCFFILVPIIALMIYGIIIAGIQLCQA